MAASEGLAAPRLLARNTVWNLVGQVAPMVAAVVSIPILIRHVGVDGFGVLSLAWILVGYFSLFDLGLGRALTRFVAEKLGGQDTAEIPPIVWTSFLLLVGLGLVGALSAALLAPWAVSVALKIPGELRGETVRAFYLVAVAVPAVTTTAAARGLLEANQRFGLVNALKLPLGILNYAGPALALPFTARIDVLVAVLLVIRYAGAAAHLVACWRVLPAQLRPVGARASLVAPLLSFGGWMTVSNVISPLMASFDRFAIGSMVSLAAVGYYVTPNEIVTKLWVIPGALVAVLFPAFSISLASEPEHARRLLDKGIRVVFLATFPVTVGIVVLAHPLLDGWIGEDMATHATGVLKWLGAGVFINCMAAVPFAYIHGAGRPDLTAKLHALEFPLYVGFLWWAVGRFGIEGAAIAWTARVTVDTLAILFLTRSLDAGGAIVGRVLRPMAVALGWMLVGASMRGAIAAGAFLAITYVGLVPVAWRFLLRADERSLLLRRFRT